MKKTAVVFGAGGQAGFYLCNLLRDKGYNVWGMGRSQCDFEDLESVTNIYKIFQEIQPDEVYNLAGLNYVPASWEAPERYMKVNGYVVLNLLEDLEKFVPKAKFFQAGSAEVFEKGSILQDESSNRLPNSPYGLSKLLAMEYVRLWREKGLFACTALFFNMESPWRAKTFFAEKVASEVVRIKRQLTAGDKVIPKCKLGRLDAIRDWGLTEEFMEAAWRMLQQDEPADFVIGTGHSYTCLQFVHAAFTAVGLGDDWDKWLTWDPTVDHKDMMRAVPTKAEKRLGWKAENKMHGVVKKLVDSELMRPYETSRVGNELERALRSS